MSEKNSSWADSRVREMVEIMETRRKARGLSLRQLTDDAGVSFDTLHGWRIGERSPWLGTLDAVLRAMGLRMMIEPDAETKTGIPDKLLVEPGDESFWKDFKYFLFRRIDETGSAAYKVGKSAGLSPSTIYNWERSGQTSITTLLRVLHVIGYTVTVVDESKAFPVPSGHRRLTGEA